MCLWERESWIKYRHSLYRDKRNKDILWALNSNVQFLFNSCSLKDYLGHATIFVSCVLEVRRNQWGMILLWSCGTRTQYYTESFLMAGYKVEVIAIEHILHCMIVIVGTRMRRSLVYRNIPCNYVYFYELWTLSLHRNFCRAEALESEWLNQALT